MRRLAAGLGLATLAALLMSPAHASLRLCNRTSYVIYAAVAVQSSSKVTVQGWTRIAPGGCAEALQGDLAAQAYYLTGRSSRAYSGPPRAWNGPTSFCAKDGNFRFALPISAACPSDGYELGFAPLDTHHMRSWTTTFRESPDLKSMAAAEHAGLKRLLADNGVKHLADNKQVDAALAAFRKRMHLADGAPPSAMFNALETEAMKSSRGAGYTVCNDTDKPFWAAIGQKKGAVYASRGWWTVAAGSCAQLVTEPVAGVWLRVERPKGAPLVAGPMRFCVTNIAFDIQGRDNCAKRGLTEAGFAPTNAQARPGYTAHVSAGGLTPN